jgi:CRISPR type IV-associated protein Csf3
MILLDELQPYFERYAGLPMEPLEIRLELHSGLAGYDPLNLDNLLARAVIEEALPNQHKIFDEAQAYALPVPLHCLWRSPDGLPLWAATPFVPQGLQAKDIAYWHKRQQSGVWTGTKRGTFSISSTSGRWMERRVPLPTIVAEYWTAQCIGNREEITRLLEPLVHVGKRRSNGHGEVKRWVVQSGDFALIRDGRLTRPMPGLAIELLDGYMPEGAPAPIGWTPPQWKVALFAPGWWTGTPVTQDYFHGALSLCQ